MTYIDMCINGSASPENWKKWLDGNQDKSTPKNELLGLLKEEYEDVENGMRSFGFYVFKRGYRRSICKLWNGCYVKYAFEFDRHEPHFETGWVDAVSNEQGFCKIQCDDCFNGNRALTIRIIDVMEILPHKERPLVYYKTMMCGDCNKCDHSSNDEPKIDCPNYDFFNAVLGKQKGDLEFLRLYCHAAGKCGGQCGQCDEEA